MQERSRKLGGMLAIFGAAAVFATLAIPGDADALCMGYRIRHSRAYYQAHQALREGNPSEARRLFLQAETYPGQGYQWMAAALTQAGRVAQAAGQHAQARSHYRAALQEQPGDWGAATALISSYESQGRLHDALLAVHALPKLLARNPAMVRIEARILERLGDVSAANALLEKLKPKETPQ
jgi:Tfp pilus assembly protein PilF